MFTAPPPAATMIGSTWKSPAVRPVRGVPLLLVTDTTRYSLSRLPGLATPEEAPSPPVPSASTISLAIANLLVVAASYGSSLLEASSSGCVALCRSRACRSRAFGRRSDHQGQLIERDSHPPVRWLLHRTAWALRPPPPAWCFIQRSRRRLRIPRNHAIDQAKPIH